MEIVCTQCQQPYPTNQIRFQCECGGIYDYEEFPEFIPFSGRNPCLGNFYSSLGLSGKNLKISLGEGGTPLIHQKIGFDDILLKMEGSNPTGSYKDRGSVTLVNWLVGRGVTEAIEDSSGNAGASFAAYAARAGIQAKVYVPQSASGPKCQQILQYGAELIKIPGARSEASKAALAEALNGAIYASHAWMPFGLPGIATIAYEIVAQLGEVPATVVAPVGHGGLLYGIIRGFEAMIGAGTIQKEPFYVGVQSSGCAPLVDAYMRKTTLIQEVVQKETLAEGVRVAQPTRAKVLLERFLLGKGQFVNIDEPDLQTAWRKYYQTGIGIEPTSALVLAAIEKNNRLFKAPIVAVITGSGYKFSTLNHQE